MARPKMKDGEVAVQIAFRASPALKAKLETLAAKDRRNLSDFVRNELLTSLEGKGIKNLPQR